MGPWPLPQNFNGPFRKLMGHMINPMGHSLHAFFCFESCATDCHCIFLASFHTHFTKHFILVKPGPKFFRNLSIFMDLSLSVSVVLLYDSDIWLSFWISLSGSMPGVIWYFEPHGKSTPGSIYHGVQNTIGHRVNVIAMIGTFFNGSICIFINWIVIIIFTITKWKVK